MTLLIIVLFQEFNGRFRADLTLGEILEMLSHATEFEQIKVHYATCAVIRDVIIE